MIARWKKALFAIIALLVAATLYLFFNANILFEQVFKFGQDYDKTNADDVRMYVATETLYDADRIANQLETTREVAQQLFNKNFDNHPSIAIFVTEPGYRGHERITGITGAYLYAMDVILINGEAPQFASSTTVHEYTHFLFNRYLKAQGMTIEEIPDWLTEGLAEYVAFQVEQALPQQHAHYYDHFPFSQLHEMTNGNMDTVYLQGFYAVYDLVERFGSDVLVQLLTTFKETNDFSSAFMHVTGMDYQTYHDYFFINRNELAKLNELKSSPQEVFAFGEQLLKNRASINPYTPFVLPDLVGAALEINDVPRALKDFAKLEPLLFNPNDYLYYAGVFHEVGQTELAEKLIEKGRAFAKKYYFDIEQFEQEAVKLLKSLE